MVGDLMQIRNKRTALAYSHTHPPSRAEKESRKILNTGPLKPYI